MRIGEAPGVPVRLLVEGIGLQEHLELLWAERPQDDVPPGPGGAQEVLQAGPVDAVGASQAGGVELALADVAVDGLPVDLEVGGGLPRGQDLAGWLNIRNNN